MQGKPTKEPLISFLTSLPNYEHFNLQALEKPLELGIKLQKLMEAYALTQGCMHKEYAQASDNMGLFITIIKPYYPKPMIGFRKHTYL